MTDLRVHAEFIPDPVRIHYGETYQGPGTVKLQGYVCGFEDVERYGGPNRGGWIERVDRTAFEQALADGPDSGLLWNFDGFPLARVKNGTLKLSLDDTGLRAEAVVDVTPRLLNQLDVGPDTPTNVPDNVQWGFSFRDRDSEWSAAAGHDDDTSHRVIKQITLGEISLVAVPDEITVSA